MKSHPLLPQFLEIAFACIACDGEIAASEVSCLRSIAIQMGQDPEDVDNDLQMIQEELARDAADLISDAKRKLRRASLSDHDSSLLLDMLVQLVEADGTVHPREFRFVRKLVIDIGLDCTALRKKHPEWSSYLAEGIHAPRGEEWRADELSSFLQEINREPRA